MDLMIRKEGDVRNWLRKEVGERVFWIEPGAGSTVGFPDALVTKDGGLIPVELKAGRIRNGIWIDGKKRGLRPSQKIVMRKMWALGIRPLLIVGRLGTSDVGRVDTLAAISGEVPLVWEKIEKFDLILRN